MKKQPLVSIALVFRKLDKYSLTCIKKCLKLDYDNFEIVLCPDEEINHEILKDKRITAIKNTGKSRTFTKGAITIPKKRNISLSVCNPKTEYFAFVDDDAYPTKDWLKNALKCFHKDVGVVGGPNLTPLEDPLLQRVTGNALQSKLCYGKGYLRHKIIEAQYVEELPTCNLVVDKDTMDKVGGFDETQPTAEDAKLCADALAVGKKIYYSPDVRVYHHRRKLFWPFMKQFYYYGLFKARLFKKDKMSSLHYLTPAFFISGLVGGFILYVISLFINNGVLSSWLSIINLIYFSVLVVYLFLLLFESVKESKEFNEFFLTVAAMFLMQFSYGFGFIMGLFLV